MSNKTCLQCKHYFPPTTKCPRYAESFSCSEKACVSFEQDPDMEKKPPTVFQQITASPEVLAEKLVIPNDHGRGYLSIIIDEGVDGYGWYKTYEEAIAATIARLNEVEK